MEETRDDDEIRTCVEEMGTFLPELAQRHSPLVVLAALSEHIGSALHLCQQAGACTPAEAREVLEELEEMVFTGVRVG